MTFIYIQKEGGEKMKKSAKKEIWNSSKGVNWQDLVLGVFLLRAILIVHLARAILIRTNGSDTSLKRNNKNKEKSFSFKSTRILTVIFAIVIAMSIAITTVMAIPTTINLQGKLLSASGSSLSGTYNFTFRIYDSYTNGNLLYESNNTLTLNARGIYDVILRDVNLSFDKQYYLGVKVGDDDEMTPRINLSSMPYAFRANISDDLNPANRYTIGILNVTNNITIGDSSEDKITVTTSNLNVSTTGNLDIAGNLTLAEKIRFSLSSVIENLVSNWLRITGNVNITKNLVVGKNFSVNNSDLFVDSNLGRVGIGTATPNNELTVVGTVNATNFIGDGSQLTGISGGRWNLSGTNLYPEDSAYNVGIGTTSPNTKLDINGNVNVTENLTVNNIYLTNASNWLIDTSTGLIREDILPYCKGDLTSDVYTQCHPGNCDVGNCDNYYNVSNLVPGNVKSGVTFGRAQTGTLLPPDGTAVEADIFKGKTAETDTDWNLETGTLEKACYSTGSVSSTYANGQSDRYCVDSSDGGTPKASDSYLRSGYKYWDGDSWNTGTATLAGAANVKSGVSNAWDGTGTLSPGGTATAGDVCDSKTFYSGDSWTQKTGSRVASDCGYIPDTWSGVCIYKTGDVSCPSEYPTKHTRQVCTGCTSCTGTCIGCNSCTGSVTGGGAGGYYYPRDGRQDASCSGQGCTGIYDHSDGYIKVWNVAGSATACTGSCKGCNSCTGSLTSCTTYTYCCQ